MLQGCQPHRRESLVGMFWPDVPEEAARTSLRQVLARLRRSISDHSTTSPFLQISRDTLQFNQASDHELDLSTFIALLGACENHTHDHPEKLSEKH